MVSSRSFDEIRFSRDFPTKFAEFSSLPFDEICIFSAFFSEKLAFFSDLLVKLLIFLRTIDEIREVSYARIYGFMTDIFLIFENECFKFSKNSNTIIHDFKLIMPHIIIGSTFKNSASNKVWIKHF